MSITTVDQGEAPRPLPYLIGQFEQIRHGEILHSTETSENGMDWKNIAYWCARQKTTHILAIPTTVGRDRQLVIKRLPVGVV
jgi:hypothetical protein